jgi:hypothetical protein
MRPITASNSSRVCPGFMITIIVLSPPSFRLVAQEVLPFVVRGARFLNP